jgi:DHA3 family macrolide efflux protein-like MFS transporter
MKDFKRVLKNKYFWALWVSQFLSQVAIHTLNFLVILRIFDYTGSTIATSLVWVAFVLPAILIGPVAATYVDFVDKKRVLLVTNLAQGGIIFLYSLASTNMIYLSYVVVLLYSIFNQFYIPAELSSLPFLVEKKNLPQANGLFLLTYQLALVVGFGLAGVVGDLMGFRAAFGVAGGVMMVAFASVSFLPKMRLAEGERAFGFSKTAEFFDEIMEGFVFIKERREVLLPFLAIVGLQVLLPVLVVNLPIISRDILRINPHYSGVAVTTPAGAGAALGILIVSKSLVKKRKKRVIKNALSVMVLSFWCAMLIVPMLPMPYKILISTLLFVLMGIGYIGIYIPAQTLLQVSTPKKMMARVFGNSWFITSAATILPMLFSASFLGLG